MKTLQEYVQDRAEIAGINFSEQDVEVVCAHLDRRPTQSLDSLIISFQILRASDSLRQFASAARRVAKTCQEFPAM